MRLLLLFVLLFAGKVLAGDARVIVDTRTGTLTVVNEERVLGTFGDISIGRYGASLDKQRGDNMTPLGTFTIGWITENSRYYRFLGLNYPDLESASRAFYVGKINKQQWLDIRRAAKQGTRPPQNTPLGGLIGIHGVGEGEIDVHRAYNWTNGCVALTNEEIDQILEWVDVGTVVEIR
ncbi:MAG: L,D-transpeptidase [Gammaproteobacteria bacterium]|nr:L,D-transpeptidase [Gammaproteobacteria bacterium]